MQGFLSGILLSNRCMRFLSGIFVTFVQFSTLVIKFSAHWWGRTVGQSLQGRALWWGLLGETGIEYLTTLLMSLVMSDFGKFVVMAALGKFVAMIALGKFVRVTSFWKVRNERITRGMSDIKYEEFCKARWKWTLCYKMWYVFLYCVKSRCINKLTLGSEF